MELEFNGPWGERGVQVSFYKVSEVNELYLELSENPLMLHYAKNLDPFCPCPEIYSQADFRFHTLICLVQGISKLYSIHRVMLKGLKFVGKVSK